VNTRYFYLIALAIIAADQATKFAVVSRLPFGYSLPLVGDAVRITVVHNSGGAFGLFQPFAGILAFIALAAIAAIIYLVRRKAPLPGLIWGALALQLGGAIGNLIDRLRFGYVIDFVDLRVWPVFNVADSAITVGMLMLAYHLLFRESPDPAEKD
jgi:signal peptidase II